MRLGELGQDAQGRPAGEGGRRDFNTGLRSPPPGGREEEVSLAFTGCWSCFLWWLVGFVSDQAWQEMRA